MESSDIEHGASTPDAILQAAYKLFTEQGYHGTSMRQIAESAGIALEGIYNHFSGKEEIFSTVLSKFHPAHEVIPAILAGANGDVENFVTHAATTIMTTLSQRPDFSNLMFIELVEFRSRHIPEIYQQIFPRGLEMVQTFARDQSGLRSIPVEVMVRAFLGLMYSLVITKALLGDQVESIGGEGEIEHYVDIFLHGIMEEGVR